jgi:dTDP-4-dehydrorhamnose reductase/mannose-6-phosphate isomerase-like protein (cupin superfamily)
MILVFGADRGAQRAVVEAMQARGAAAEADPGADPSSMKAIREAVVPRRPSAVVVLGPDLSVEEAELSPEHAFSRLAEDVIHFAAAAREAKAKLVLVSSAEIYGQRGGPFMESDDPEPASVWAQAMKKGEHFALRADPSALVLRAGPILAPGLQPFVRAYLAKAVVTSPGLVSPYLASDLGGAVVDLLATQKSGIFHLTASDSPVERRALAGLLAAAIGRPSPGPPPAAIAGPRAASYAPRAVLLAEKVQPYLSAAARSWREALSALGQGVVLEDSKMAHKQEVRRVEKPWGHEIIWAHSDRYVGKLLFIRAGERLSLQYHEQKDETVYVLSGKMAFEVGPKDAPREDLIMKAGDAYHITPLTVHRMIALEDTQILEASTTELNDVVRLEDKYGRQGTSAP